MHELKIGLKKANCSTQCKHLNMINYETTANSLWGKNTLKLNKHNFTLCRYKTWKFSKWWDLSAWSFF